MILAATTGARRAQLLGLRWPNVNLADGQVAFTNGWVEGPTGPVLTDTKTKRRHTVELDAATTELLAEHARRITAIVGGLNRDGFVFTNDNRGVQAWKPNWVTKTFQRAVSGAGLRPFRLHDLRHFMATEMLHAGVPIPIVSRRLDHRRISTTLDFYAHATPSGDRFAAEILRHKTQAMRAATTSHAFPCLVAAAPSCDRGVFELLSAGRARQSAAGTTWRVIGRDR